MALGLRSFTNKFSNLGSYITPRCHVVNDSYLKDFATVSNRLGKIRIRTIGSSPTNYYKYDFKYSQENEYEDISSLVNEPSLTDTIDKISISTYNFHKFQSELVGNKSCPNIKCIPTSKESSEYLASTKRTSSSNKPSPEKLAHIYRVLSETLPKFFAQVLDYSAYDEHMVFENNIRGTRTVGLYNYIKQMSVLKTIAHLKFAYVKLEILKITQNPEDSSIKVRWRIIGISGIKAIMLFWKYKLWNIKDFFDKTEAWYDGFSTFYVNGEGKIYKHVADKMMPDSDVEIIKPSPMSTAKLALIVGIIPRFSDLNLMV